ncbi:hypothetical protein [Natronobiforma cellulositropha]|nr:hypothetical protein [Natronobiforma cellulositropha]
MSRDPQREESHGFSRVEDVKRDEQEQSLAQVQRQAEALESRHDER